MMKTSRDESIDFIKGLLIIFVVYGHSMQFLLYSQSSDFWSDPFFKAIYMFHMPAFIAISGYLAGFKIVRSLSLNSFILKRVKPIIVPLITWSLIIGLLGYAKHGTPDESFIDVTKSFLSAVYSNYWFLWAVIAGSFCAWISSRFNKNWQLAIFILSSILLIVPLDSSLGNTQYLVRFTVPFYLLAYAIARQNVTLRALGFLPTVLLLVLGALIFRHWDIDTYIYNNNLEYWLPGSLLNIGTMLIGSLVTTIAFLRCGVLFYDHFFRLKHLYLINKIGKYTLEIYLVQTVYFKLHMAFPLFNLHGAWGYIACLTDTFFAVILSIAFCHFTRRSQILSSILWGRKRVTVST